MISSTNWVSDPPVETDTGTNGSRNGQILFAIFHVQVPLYYFRWESDSALPMDDSVSVLRLAVAGCLWWSDVISDLCREILTLIISTKSQYLL